MGILAMFVQYKYVGTCHKVEYRTMGSDCPAQHSANCRSNRHDPLVETAEAWIMGSRQSPVFFPPKMVQLTDDNDVELVLLWTE